MQIFSLSLLFVFSFNSIFCRSKFLILIRFNLLLSPLMHHAFSVKSENTLASPKSQIFYPMFFSRHFIILHLSS